MPRRIYFDSPNIILQNSSSNIPSAKWQFYINYYSMTFIYHNLQLYAVEFLRYQIVGSHLILPESKIQLLMCRLNIKLIELNWASLKFLHKKNQTYDFWWHYAVQSSLKQSMVTVNYEWHHLWALRENKKINIENYEAVWAVKLLAGNPAKTAKRSTIWYSVFISNACLWNFNKNFA